MSACGTEPIEGIEEAAEVIVIISNELDRKTALEKNTKQEGNLSHLQMQSGFVQTVLASKEEDVWNDL